MKFKLELELDNAAFEDCPEHEIAVFLENIVATLEYNTLFTGHRYPLIDRNGNRVGFYVMENNDDT